MMVTTIERLGIPATREEFIEKAADASEFLFNRQAASVTGKDRVTINPQAHLITEDGKHIICVSTSEDPPIASVEEFAEQVRQATSTALKSTALKGIVILAEMHLKPGENPFYNITGFSIKPSYAELKEWPHDSTDVMLAFFEWGNTYDAIVWSVDYSQKPPILNKPTRMQVPKELVH